MGLAWMCCGYGTPGMRTACGNAKGEGCRCRASLPQVSINDKAISTCRAQPISVPTCVVAH